jgi:hypothetical protein
LASKESSAPFLSASIIIITVNYHVRASRSGITRISGAGIAVITRNRSVGTSSRVITRISGASVTVAATYGNYDTSNVGLAGRFLACIRFAINWVVYAHTIGTAVQGTKVSVAAVHWGKLTPAVRRTCVRGARVVVGAWGRSVLASARSASVHSAEVIVVTIFLGMRTRTGANGSNDGISGARVAIIAIKYRTSNSQALARGYSSGTARLVLIESNCGGSSKRGTVRADDEHVNTNNESGGFRNF